DGPAARRAGMTVGGPAAATARSACRRSNWPRRDEAPPAKWRGTVARPDPADRQAAASSPCCTPRPESTGVAVFLEILTPCARFARSVPILRLQNGEMLPISPTASISDRTGRAALSNSGPRNCDASRDHRDATVHLSLKNPASLPINLLCVSPVR